LSQLCFFPNYFSSWFSNYGTVGWRDVPHWYCGLCKRINYALWCYDVYVWRSV